MAVSSERIPGVTAADEPIQVNIFEVINQTLREVYIGSTPAVVLDSDRIQALILPSYPEWRPEHKVTFEFVQSGVCLDAKAPAFILEYARTLAHLGWTVLTNQPTKR